jgi:hypothetical protein
MKYAVALNSKGEWWIVRPQHKLPDEEIVLLKAKTNQAALKEARNLGFV